MTTTNPHDLSATPAQKPMAANDDPASDPAAPEAPPAEALAAEIVALKDKNLRALAELENLRRRAERDLADARAYGISGFAREMLGVLDNLRRALDSLPPESRGSAPDLWKTFVEGVELTERDFLARLGRAGVRKLEPLGEKFDPNFHDALFEAPDPGMPNGHVAQVVETGYSIGDRVLRPAKVGVARGGPKA